MRIQKPPLEGGQEPACPVCRAAETHQPPGPTTWTPLLHHTLALSPSLRPQPRVLYPQLWEDSFMLGCTGWAALQKGPPTQGERLLLPPFTDPETSYSHEKNSPSSKEENRRGKTKPNILVYTSGPMCSHIVSGGAITQTQSL